MDSIIISDFGLAGSRFRCLPQPIGHIPGKQLSEGSTWRELAYAPMSRLMPVSGPTITFFHHLNADRTAAQRH